MNITLSVSKTYLGNDETVSVFSREEALFNGDFSLSCVCLFSCNEFWYPAAACSQLLTQFESMLRVCEELPAVTVELLVEATFI